MENIDMASSNQIPVSIENLVNTHNPDNATIQSSSRSNINYYSGMEAAPYLVCLRSTDKNISNLHPMKIGKILAESNKFPSIIQIKPQSKKQLEIIFENYVDANLFINSDICTKHNLQAFIPYSRTHSVGIIRGVSTDLSPEEIQMQIRTDNSVPVTNVYRFNRRTITEQGTIEYIPTQTCKITFKSNLLPTRVFIYHISCTVEKYKPPILQCLNCKGFGHTAKYCRSEKQCGKCSDNHNTEECKNTQLRCPNCQAPHKTRTPVCEIYKQELMINNKMTTLNLNRQEAKNIVLGKTTYARILTDKAAEQDMSHKNSTSIILPFNSKTNTSKALKQKSTDLPTILETNKKRKSEGQNMTRRTDFNNTYYNTSQQIYQSGRLPTNKELQQHNSQKISTIVNNNNTCETSLITSPLVDNPMSEAKFLGTINQIINEAPDTLRNILESLKQNQLWFYQHRK